MDKHKALIEAVMVALVNVERTGILPPIQKADQIIEMDRPYVEEAATAAINAVYEALKEPSEEMIWAADPHAGPTVSFRVWQAMLSASALSSPLGEGE